jgi:hypothetical protein
MYPGIINPETFPKDDLRQSATEQSSQPGQSYEGQALAVALFGLSCQRLAYGNSLCFHEFAPVVFCGPLSLSVYRVLLHGSRG